MVTYTRAGARTHAPRTHTQIYREECHTRRAESTCLLVCAPTGTPASCDVVAAKPAGGIDILLAEDAWSAANMTFEIWRDSRPKKIREGGRVGRRERTRMTKRGWRGGARGGND